MRRPRPVARYSEVAFAFVAGMFLAWGIIAWWPQPALNVTPIFCRTEPLPPTVQPADGLPPAYERYTR